MKERNWKYKINGGWPTLIMASVMLAIFGGITVWLYTTRNGAFIGGLIVTACMAIGFILSVCSVLFLRCSWIRTAFLSNRTGQRAVLSLQRDPQYVAQFRQGDKRTPADLLQL